MKLTCTKENFKKAISNAEHIVSKQNTLPILNNILLEAEKGFLNIIATNLEIGIKIKVGAKVEKEGSIAVPAKLLGNFSANLISGENVDIEVDGYKLKIKNGLTKASIKGFSPDEFPLIPQKKTEFIFGISILKLKDIFNKIIISVAHNDARQELSGVNISFFADKIAFAATDGFRLSERVLMLKEFNINNASYVDFFTKNSNIIVPLNTLLELNKIISNGFEENVLVNVFIEDGQIFFELDGVKIVSRLINGKYPEYKHIMPENYKTTIIGEKKLLQNALKMAGVFADGKSREVVLKIDTQAMTVFIDTISAETGENSTEVKFEAHGESQEVVFNLKYLSDGINVITTENLVLLANSDSSPVALREVGVNKKDFVEGFTYIVMPIKN
jgi:DNA polymerase-3 subunit beta